MILFIVAFALITILSLVGFFVANKKSQALNKLNNKRAILYYLLFAIVISAGGLIALSLSAARSMTFFILLQVGYAGLGYLASYLYKKNAPVEMTEGRFAGVFFVLANAFIGMIGFMLVFELFDPSGVAPWYSFCVLPFVLPQFLATSFSAFRSIPQEIHKVWYFPLHADEVDYDQIDTSTIYMLELEYSKSINDARLTNTKLRAPVAMKFGDWFRSFIENYNYKYESDPIQYMNDDQTPLGWIFYTRPGGLLGKSKYIDPDLTITENNINEKYVILAKRVSHVEEEEMA